MGIQYKDKKSQKLMNQNNIDNSILRLANIIFKKMNIEKEESYDILEIYNILYSNSHMINNISNNDISKTVEELFKVVKIENSWKVFVLLYYLAELSSDRISIFYEYNIYEECVRNKIYSSSEAKKLFKENILNIGTIDNIDNISDIFIGYLFMGIESMAYYGTEKFSLLLSEIEITEWITGFGNFVEYNNSISKLFKDINSYHLLDEIMDKFIFLLSSFYRVDLQNSKNIDQTYNWEQVSETVCSGLL